MLSERANSRSSIGTRPVAGNTGVQLVVAAALFLAFVATAWMEKANVPLGQEVTGFVERTDSGGPGVVYQAMCWLGGFPTWDLLVLLLAAFLYFGHRRSQSVFMIMGLSIEAATILIKIVLIDGSFSPGFGLSSLLESSTAGFPSGHVARTTVTLGLVVALFAFGSQRWRVRSMLLGCGFVLLMAIARLGTGAHGLGEVVGGCLLGLLWVCLLMIAWSRWTGHPDSRGSHH